MHENIKINNNYQEVNLQTLQQVVPTQKHPTTDTTEEILIPLFTPLSDIGEDSFAVL
jgi:hypothetical protein